MSAQIIKAEWGKIVDMCRGAHASNLMPGFSGNASIRHGDECLVTTAGCPKGRLTEQHMSIVDISSGKVLSDIKPSSEVAMHLEIYRRVPEARAVLHTHPPYLTALGLRLFDQTLQQRLDMELFEAQVFIKRATAVPRLEPGQQGLAEAVGAAAVSHGVIWLEGHGLCVWADSPEKALALSEGLEHLAQIKILSLS